MTGNSEDTPVPEFGPSDAQILDREPCYRGFFSIEKLTVKHKLFAGGWSPEIQRELFIQRSSAGVLLYDPDLDKVLLIEQFRIGTLAHGLNQHTRPWLLETVAGLREEGESAAELVKREAWEEAGCRVKDLIPISEYFNSPGGSSERIALFCGHVDARGAGGIHGLPEENEDIRVVVLSFDEVWHALREGKIANAMAIIAIQWLYINREDVRKRWKQSSR